MCWSGITGKAPLEVNRTAERYEGSLHDGLGHARVRVRVCGELLDGRLEHPGNAHLADQLAHVVPDHVNAQDLSVLGIGDDLDEARRVIQNGSAERFWSDGMVRVSGREFNGLLDTACYQRGEMSCLSCHSMHQKPDDPRPLADWTDDQLAEGILCERPET